MGLEMRMMAASGDDDKDKPVEFTSDAASSNGHNGTVTVPAKPSAQMLAAGARAGDVSVEVAWRVYQAMIKAAR